MSQKPNVTRPKSLKAKMAAPEVDLGFRWSTMNSMLLSVGVAVLAAGYMSLAKGSLTLAPVLLVAGYCVLIPRRWCWKRAERANSSAGRARTSKGSQVRALFRPPAVVLADVYRPNERQRRYLAWWSA